jgi:hypothetical protein
LCRGPIAHSLGVLARTTGELALAEEHFAEAEDINTRMDAPFFRARTWLEWAGLLLDRGGGGDSSRAERMLHQALDVAHARGYAQVERRAERALASLG